MTLYDKLKEDDKEKINDHLCEPVINALKDINFISGLNFYQICELHWLFNPTSNKINIVEIQNLFESKN